MTVAKRLAVILVGLVVVLAVAVWLVYSNLNTIARGILEREIPNLTFSKLDLQWDSVDVEGVTFGDGKGKVLLKTDRLLVKPSLASITGDTFVVNSVLIKAPYVYVERRASGEVVFPVPAPAGSAAPADATAQKPADEGPLHAIRVGSTVIEGGKGEFVDRSVGQPPAKFTISAVNVRLGEVNVPQKPGAIPLSASLTVDAKRPGRVNVDGAYDAGARSGDIKLKVASLFIPLAEPYLRSPDTTARLADGTISLGVDALMNGGNVKLAGDVTLADLKFDGSGGKFLGVPVKVVDEYLRTHEPRLTIPFEVEGNVDRPEELRVRVISVLAKRLLERLGQQEVQKVTDKLKQGDVEGAKAEVKNLEKSLKKGLKGLFGQ